MLTDILTELELEERLIKELSENGYERIYLEDLDGVHANLRVQLEKLNDVKIDDENFKKILAYLNGDNVFNKAKKLRDRCPIEVDGKVHSIIFLDLKDWCKNIFQVSNQITIKGKRENRYDVTILFNGIPMVQIELKRPGIDVKESFNQCCRYKHESMGNTLFDYVQLFVISNGNITRYFVNNVKLDADQFGQTIEYSDSDNKKINKLSDFRLHFLEKCQLSKLITQYIILVDGGNGDEDKLVLMRPYQVHAVEEIANKIDDSIGNGYIWHTTGSGKTLTSFKAAELISKRDDVDKVIFVVDRTDLDAQTTSEFKKFGSNLSHDEIVKEYKNTREVMVDLKSTQKMLVTTIQKLDNATKRLVNDQELKDKRIVLIFDECHRSQKGDMHKRIDDYFNNVQKIGFTGTPIFLENSTDFKTTEEIFGKCMHKYILPNAISDKKVLGFSVEYYNPFEQKLYTEDEQVKSVDVKEIYASDEYIDLIVKSIYKNFDKNTKNRKFTGMLACDGIKNAVNYYQHFKSYNETLSDDQKPIRIGCIYSWNPNEEQSDKNSRDDLDMIMQDYNKQYKCNYTTDNFSGYRIDLMDKIKKRKIDLIIVSDMLLTGFDAPGLNTLYVDKNMQYHGLIQAFSRTNRICGSDKDYGNIICFRPIQERVHEAVTLFSNKENIESILKPPFEDYLLKITNLWDELNTKFPSADAVNNIDDPEELKDFIETFKDLNKNFRYIESFTDFERDKLPFTMTEFITFKDVYREKARRSETGKVSILDDIDFEMELIEAEVIDYVFILNLLKQMVKKDNVTRETIEKQLDSIDMPKSKRELIAEFIGKYLEQRPDGDMEDLFESFNQEYKNRELKSLMETENLSPKFMEFMAGNEYQQGQITDVEVKGWYTKAPSVLDRGKTANRIIEKIKEIYSNINY